MSFLLYLPDIELLYDISSKIVFIRQSNIKFYEKFEGIKQLFQINYKWKSFWFPSGTRTHAFSIKKPLKIRI